jgi:DNA modification methylase
VRHYLERFQVGPGDCVLDPFCGTGTTLVECKKRGIPSVGMEPHPVAHLASAVKTDWSINGFGLITHARGVAERTLGYLAQQGICDTRTYAPVEPEEVPLRRLAAEAEKLLLKGSISPVPLHKALVLLDALKAEEQSLYYRHEMLALARALSAGIGNLHFGPEVGVTQPKADTPVVGAWLECVHGMGSDLATLEGARDTLSMPHCADARDVSQFLDPESVSVVITSPPYPNEKDYTRITRLESVLLGFLRTRADLRALKRRLVRSNTRGVYKGDSDDAWVSGHTSVQRIAGAIEARRTELGKTSGFERQYASVTKLYFGGMKRHLSELRRCLRRGANLAYVVGDQASYLRVMIRTGALLAEIAESLGYEVVGIDLFRTRLATATREQLREEVVVLRWPGTG